jgi:hypothetical protein
MGATYTREKLVRTLRSHVPTNVEFADEGHWGIEDIVRSTMRVAAFAHAGFVELSNEDDAVVTAAVLDLANFGDLRFADPLADCRHAGRRCRSRENSTTASPSRSASRDSLFGRSACRMVDHMTGLLSARSSMPRIVAR